MRLQSLGYRSELIFPNFDGSVEDRGNHLVVKTPRNPGFYWGNLLIFDRPPRAGDREAWEALFAEAFEESNPGSHRTFGWDAPGGDPGAVEEFRDAGYELVNDPVLTISKAPASRQDSLDVQLRPLKSDSDWRSFVELNTVCDPLEDKAGTSYSLFKQRLRDRYARLIEAERGFWLGAFEGARLVAGLGLFSEGELGRFQSVETHPDYRRRGLCSALVREACRLGLEEMGLERLVILADDGGDAERLYRSLGFESKERLIGVYRRPQSDSPKAT